MSTTTPIVCNPGIWTQVATGAAGITDITIQGPAFGYRVAIDSAPPGNTTTGILPDTTTGEFKARNIGTADNVYVTPVGFGAIAITDITSVAVSGGGGSGGGGGPVTLADGASIALGARADTAYSDATGAASGSLITIIKGLFVKLSGTLSVTGTFWPATQPVSLAVLPALATGANLIGAVNLDLGGSAVANANPLPTIDAFTAPAVLAWTSATALNSAATITTGGYDTVIVTLVGNAALAGGAVAFEVSDGASWIAVKAGSVSDYTTAASVSLTATMNRGYQVPVAGFPQFRVRLASVIGAGSLTVTMITSSAPDTSIVTVGLDPLQALPAGTNVIGTVIGPLPASPITGQQVLTTTAAVLPANALQNGLIVTALSANSGTVYVGAPGVTATTGYPLSAGQAISFAVANASGIAIIGTNATDKVAFAGN